MNSLGWTEAGALRAPGLSEHQDGLCRRACEASPAAPLQHTCTRALVSQPMSPGPCPFDELLPIHPNSFTNTPQQRTGLSGPRWSVSATGNSWRRGTWLSGAQCPFGHCCVEQRGQERRAPPRGEAGKDTTGTMQPAGEAGSGVRTSWRAGWEPGRQAGPPAAGRPPPPPPARDRTAATLLLPPFPDYYHFFPRKAGIRGCPSEPRRGRHFPGKARRASAPGAPEREPEGSARPRALLRAGRAPGSGVLAPRAPAPARRPAPPRSFHCQPGKPAPGPAPPEAPERPRGLPRPLRSPRPPAPVPSAAGRLPPPPAPQTRHPREPPAPAASSLARGPPLDPHPASALPLRPRCPGSSPAAGILPLLCRPRPPLPYFLRKQVGQLDL